MIAILWRIREVGVQYKIKMTENERRGDTVSLPPPLQTAIDTEQFRNVQDSERYAIHVSGPKTYYQALYTS